MSRDNPQEKISSGPHVYLTQFSVNPCRVSLEALFLGKEHLGIADKGDIHLFTEHLDRRDRASLKGSFNHARFLRLCGKGPYRTLGFAGYIASKDAPRIACVSLQTSDRKIRSDDILGNEF